jgi:acetyltransferase
MSSGILNRVRPARRTPRGSGWDRVTRVLRDGTAAVVRPVTPADRSELAREFERLSLDSRRSRFFCVVGALSEDALDYLTRVDQEEHLALVAAIESCDLKTERGIGVGRMIRLTKGSSEAEVAITVADDMQHRGVGSVLFDELLGMARLRGIREVRAEVLATNAPMRRILQRAGGKPVLTEHGDGVVSYGLST